MTDQYQQEDINLAGQSGVGGQGNVIMVPFISMAAAGPTGPNYFIQLGAPQNRFGNAASDWEITPGVPGASSGSISSATRTASYWNAQAFLQQGPSSGIPRAFFSAFYDGVGVAGGAQSFQGNNYRSDVNLREGGLTSGAELSFSIAWNGNTPLTLNSGNIFLLST